MVIKGRSRTNGVQLADYLLKNAENDRAQVIDIRGTARPDDLKKSLREMSMSSELTKRGKLGLYHAQVNPAIGEDRPMTDDDWLRAADILEEHLGFSGQKRALVLHEKEGRIHAHVVWERYDHETGRLRADGKNYDKHDSARAQIEQELDHERTPQKPEKELTHKERLTDLWRQHPDGRDFVEAAQAEGYQVAQGNDRRPFRVITPDGQSLDLTRQLDDVRTKEVRGKLQPIRTNLPTEAEALKHLKDDRNPVLDPDQPEPQRSNNLHELSDSQDLALAMINRVRQPEPDKKISFSIKFSQELKQPSEMLYSELLADQAEQLRKATEDHFVARETIKTMQNGHFAPSHYDGEVERLDAAHKRQIEAMQTSFEEKRREFLKEPPAIPRDQEQKIQSDKTDDLSDKQDQAAAMLKQYQEQRAAKQNKIQEAKTQGKEQTAPANDDTFTDEAERLLQEYQQRQRELKQNRGMKRGL